MDCAMCKCCIGLGLLKEFWKYFILFYLALPQGQGHHNSVSQLLWARSTYPTLSTIPVGGNRSTRRKPTTFGRALTLLFSHEIKFCSDPVRSEDYFPEWKPAFTGDRTRTLEVKGEWSDHYTMLNNQNLSSLLTKQLRISLDIYYKLVCMTIYWKLQIKFCIFCK